MTDLEHLLADLAETPPSGLERRTVVAAGAADLVARTESPMGSIWIAWSTSGITALSPTFAYSTIDEFLEYHRRVSFAQETLPEDLETKINTALETGSSEHLSFDLRGLSDFQQSVLEVCATIPAGDVRPYGWIAEEINKPGATRAVGTALGSNPIPFLIPCHRVVRSDGSVGSYAFGSEMKRDLLVSEGAISGTV